ASAMLQVVYPFVCGLGGDVFMVIYDARSGKLYGLNGSGRSAQAATIERYRDLGYTTMPVLGIHTVTVPGCVDGWNEAEQRLGRLGLAQALAPAISYAVDGFDIEPDLHAALTTMSTRQGIHRSWHTHFLQDVRNTASAAPRHSSSCAGNGAPGGVSAEVLLRSLQLLTHIWVTHARRCVRSP